MWTDDLVRVVDMGDEKALTLSGPAWMAVSKLADPKKQRDDS
jgi:hypothetical protein